MPTPNRRRRRRIAQEANLLKLDTDIKTKHFMKLQVAKDEHKNTQTYIYIYIKIPGLYVLVHLQTPYQLAL
jgi:hypothetical protein